MEILITNDDGYQAKGINVLTELMSQIGNVTVVAPDGPRSAQSNAITVITPLRMHKIKESENVRIYSCTGTPTDCVKIAFHEIFTERKPDLIVSGINHGANSAINVIYSGTMGAVLEGCEHGIKSIGFSLCDYDADADFSHFSPYIVTLTKQIIAMDVPEGTCFNINAPKGTIKGTRKVRQCKARWEKEFETRIDPQGKPYYWITGIFVNLEPDSPDTDERALAEGYISIVPTKIDMTDYDFIDKFDI